MKVPFVNLSAQFESLEQPLTEAFLKVGRSGGYILGEEVQRFETALATLCQTKYAVTVANGTDALILVLKAWGIKAGDEVITAPNSFIASAGAIAMCGAKPVFVDVADDFNIDPTKIEQAITSATKAIIPVHLTGNPANMDAINAIAGKYGLKVLEDAAQAIGAMYHGRAVGSLGDAAAFSLHPLKNFHLMGDAGFISTNDKALYDELITIRNHGLINRDESMKWSVNSRLDAMQAAFGNVKISYFAGWTARFQNIARHYHRELKDVLKCPVVGDGVEPVYHNFVVQVEEREALMAFLANHNVDTKIHYPIPLHLMACSETLGYHPGDFPVTEQQSKLIMSLPIYPELTDEQVQYVCDMIKAFYNKEEH